MALKIRRVITGHDANGKAKVLIDEVAKNVISGPPGRTSCVIWTTEGFPVDNDGDADDRDPQGRHDARRAAACFAWWNSRPASPPRNHRTDSIDFAVVMSGEIDMELDDSGCTSRRATCWCSAARSTTGSTAAARRADRIRAGRRQAGRGGRKDPARGRVRRSKRP